jgi:hypothetical protein
MVHVLWLKNALEELWKIGRLEDWKIEFKRSYLPLSGLIASLELKWTDAG